MSDLATGLAVNEGETAISPEDISAYSSQDVLKSSVDNLCGTETEDEVISSETVIANRETQDKLSGDLRSTHVNPLLNTALVGNAEHEPMSEGPQEGRPAETAEACLLPEDEIADGIPERGTYPNERRVTTLTELYAQAESFRKASVVTGDVVPEPMERQTSSSRFNRQQTLKRETTMTELYEQAESFRLKSCDPIGPEAGQQLQERMKASHTDKNFRVSALYADYSTPTAQLVDEDWWAVIIGVVFFVGALFVHMVDENFEFPNVSKWKTGERGTTFSDGFFAGSAMVVMTAAVTLTLAFSFLRDRPVIAVSKAFAIPFICISFLVFVSIVIGFEEKLHDSGLKPPFWAVIFGMVIGNFLHFLAERKVGRLAIWAKMLQVGLSPVVRQTELFIKIGLVLLSIDLPHLLELFWRSLLMSLIGPPIIFCSAYYVGAATNCASKPVLIMLAAGLSSTGVMAGTMVSSLCGACAEDRTIATVVIVLTSCIHMFIMPAMANQGDLDNDNISGAWLGCVDVTSNSVAGSSLVSSDAKETASVTKICQSLVLSIAVAAYDAAAKISDPEMQRSSGIRFLANLGKRTPRFVLGLVALTLLQSLVKALYGSSTSDHISELLQGSNEWWFCFGYVTIGLSTNVQKLLQYIDGTGILLLCFVAQSFDSLLTFGLAHLFYAGIPLDD